MVFASDYSPFNNNQQLTVNMLSDIAVGIGYDNNQSHTPNLFNLQQSSLNEIGIQFTQPFNNFNVQGNLIWNLSNIMQNTNNPDDKTALKEMTLKFKNTNHQLKIGYIQGLYNQYQEVIENLGINLQNNSTNILNNRLNQLGYNNIMGTNSETGIIYNYQLSSSYQIGLHYMLNNTSNNISSMQQPSSTTNYHQSLAVGIENFGKITQFNGVFIYNHTQNQQNQLKQEAGKLLTNDYHSFVLAFGEKIHLKDVNLGFAYSLQSIYQDHPYTNNISINYDNFSAVINYDANQDHLGLIPAIAYDTVIDISEHEYQGFVMHNLTFSLNYQYTTKLNYFSEITIDLRNEQDINKYTIINSNITQSQANHQFNLGVRWQL